jgi:glycosyltransferase involved in cell wall biosynthesis
VKISVAMATYNGASYIREQLESFVHQSRRPDELVITDDGSVDGTVNIIRDFALCAPFQLKVHINGKRLGYTHNFARALSLCSGDLIFISDQDDVWLPEKIDLVVEAFRRSPHTLVVINDAELMDAQGTRLGLTKAGQMVAAGASTDLMVTGCCTAIRGVFKSVVLPVPDEAESHDDWIHAVARSLDKRLFLQEVLQLYRRHTENVSHSFTSSTRRISRVDRLLQLLKDAGDRKATIAKLRRQKARLNAVLARLTERRSVLLDELGLDSVKLSATVSMLRRTQELNSQRLVALKAPRLRRPIRVFGLWRRGIYQHMGGWKSALKDILLN